MRHSRFKYFHNPDHAQQFLDGKMFCWNAAYYSDYEDVKAAQVVGDEYEGTRLYRPLNGLEITNLTQHTQANLQRGAEFITKAHEIFIYCVSMSFNDALKTEFDAKACVEICDPLKFIQRWQRALPPEALLTSGAVGDYQKYVCRMVRYYHPHDLPGNVWAIPISSRLRSSRSSPIKRNTASPTPRQMPSSSRMSGVSWLIAKPDQPQSPKNTPMKR